jgi:hypothetical protein
LAYSLDVLKNSYTHKFYIVPGKRGTPKSLHKRGGNLVGLLACAFLAKDIKAKINRRRAVAKVVPYVVLPLDV